MQIALNEINKGSYKTRRKCLAVVMDILSRATQPNSVSDIAFKTRQMANKGKIRTPFSEEEIYKTLNPMRELSLVQIDWNEPHNPKYYLYEAKLVDGSKQKMGDDNE